MQHTLRSALFVATVVGGTVGFASSAAASCGDQSYIGTICTFAFNFCPVGTLPADGRTLQIASNQALFSLLGAQYGGDGRSTFALPDLKGRGAIGTGTGAGLANITLSQKVGQQSIILTSAQVPLRDHSHTAIFSGTGGGGTGTLIASGTVSLPLFGGVKDVPINGTVGASAVTGTISAKALSAATSGGVNVPSATHNTVGRVGGGSTTFYAPSTSDVVVPTTFALQASGGTLTATGTGGALTGTATGNASLAVTGATGITGGSVSVAPAGQPASQAVPTMSPSIGQTMCIVVEGLYPMRP